MIPNLQKRKLRQESFGSRLKVAWYVVKGQDSSFLIQDFVLSQADNSALLIWYFQLFSDSQLQTVKWKRETLYIIFVLRESIQLPVQWDVLLPGMEVNLPFNYMLMTIQLLCKGIRSLGAFSVEDVQCHRTLDYDN